MFHLSEFSKIYVQMIYVEATLKMFEMFIFFDFMVGNKTFYFCLNIDVCSVTQIYIEFVNFVDQ